MISYAQNGEDVVLERVFADVAQGFYVDIGASDPVVDSVTRHFYERGWCGVNVEPDPLEFERLAAARDRDVNLEAAVGSGQEPVTFYPSAVRGHGTLDATLANDRGETATLPIPQIGLSQIFEEHAPSEGVDFLKIDVEGWEADVLASADWERDRPRVVVVEAVDLTGRPTHERWEPTLLDHRYSLGLFDGLNRFYYRNEEADKIGVPISAPANPLDDWARAGEVALEEQLRELAGRVHGLGVLQAETDVALDDALNTLDVEREAFRLVRAELSAVYDSTSWRLTAPVRDASRLARLMRRDTVA